MPGIDITHRDGNMYLLKKCSKKTNKKHSYKVCCALIQFANCYWEDQTGERPTDAVDELLNINEVSVAC